MRIAETRKKKGMSQRELSLALGVSENYICLVEGGKIHPSDQIKRQLSEILGVSVGFLFFEEKQA